MDAVMDVIPQAGGPAHAVHAAVSGPELCPHTDIAGTTGTAVAEQVTPAGRRF